MHGRISDLLAYKLYKKRGGGGDFDEIIIIKELV